MHHARQVRVEPKLVEELTAIANHNWSDPSARQLLVNRLVQVGTMIGLFITRQQPDYRERDMPGS
jgi:hypothetical protein